MGIMVIASFRPKPGKEADLLACTHDHLPVLAEAKAVFPDFALVEV